MKKNKMMRLAAVLLICVLLSTSVISGTFAKYTTQDSASDVARVAKWGINVIASGNLFGEKYATVATADVGNKIVANSTNVASAGAVSNIENVVAPGTKNDEGFKITLSGTPEVSYTIKARTGESILDSNGIAKPINEDIFLGTGTWGVMVKATGLNPATKLTDYYYLDGSVFKPADANAYYVSGDYYELHDVATVTGSPYYPIKWKVDETGNAAPISETSNLVNIANSMVTGLQETSVDANTIIDSSYTLTWEWTFEEAPVNYTAGYNVAANDAKDTILGHLMAGNTDCVVVIADGDNYKNPTAQSDYNLDIVFNFEVIVEQVD